MIDLIQPQNIVVNDKTYIISKFPATEGREIIAKYPLSSLPKLGDYKINEETMFKLMAYVAVEVAEGKQQRLTTRELINNHVPSWESLARIEMEMIKYNCSFFQNGRVSNFLADIAQNVPTWITKILTDSLAQLSQTEKPHSTN